MVKNKKKAQNIAYAYLLFFLNFTFSIIISIINNTSKSKSQDYKNLYEQSVFENSHTYSSSIMTIFKQIYPNTDKQIFNELLKNYLLILN